MNRWTLLGLAALPALSALVFVWATHPFVTRSCADYVVASGNTFRVCITKNNDGYDASVTHFAGPTYGVELNLITSDGSYAGAGTFYLNAGESWTHTFAVGQKSSAVVRLYWRTRSPAFNPMDSPPCNPNCN